MRSPKTPGSSGAPFCFFVVAASSLEESLALRLPSAGLKARIIVVILCETRAGPGRLKPVLFGGRRGAMVVICGGLR